MKILFFKLLVGIFWIGLSYLIFISSINESVLLSNNFKKNIQYFFPEGWGFFTKEPKEDLLDVYKIDSINNYQEISIKNSNLDNNIGFSRIARIKGYELSNIAPQISSEKWKDDKFLNFYKHIKDSSLRIKSKKEFRYFNTGTYLLIQKKAIPWAWASSNQSKFIPIRIIKIKIN